jgi:23S rRNA (cytidine1920-2'-O)/16S rRNA (cytidine1409-2'-O)-methyltransferase
VIVAKKRRIDILMVERGLAESRAAAQRMVMAGQVRVGGQPVAKPSQQVEPGQEIALDPGPRYVSRGGDKLAHALRTFSIDVTDRVCADVGASTGGFTDCLLQNGAARVYALDVGRGILHWRLRQDERVIVMEGVNARYQDQLPERVDLAVVDAAFISLELLIPVIRGWLTEGGQLVALIKPQFEAGRETVGRAGVVRDSEVHRIVVRKIMAACSALGLAPQGLTRSPLTGPKGNIEFLLWSKLGGNFHGEEDLLRPVFEPRLD